MAIGFEEIRKYIARDVRISVCFQDGYYHNYLMISDIPEHKYDGLYVYGIGMVNVEFSRDVYSVPKEQEGIIRGTEDDILASALEIVLYPQPREIARSTEEALLFRDLKPYLQIFGNISVVNREDWSFKTYEYRDDMPGEYDENYVYGVGMEDNPDVKASLKNLEYDTCLKKRMVVVLSKDDLKKKETKM